MNLDASKLILLARKEVTLRFEKSKGRVYVYYYPSIGDQELGVEMKCKNTVWKNP